MFISYTNFKEHCEDSDKNGIQNDCGSYAIQKRLLTWATGKERDTTISVSLQEH